MKKHHILLFLFIVLKYGFMANFAYGQKIYEGQVLDKTTELPIPSTTVTLLNQNKSVLANDQGYFKIVSNSTNTEDVLTFTSTGYKTDKMQVKGGSEYVNVKLEPATVSLNEVVIKSEKAKKITLEKFSLSDIREEGVMMTGVMIGTSLFNAKLFMAPVNNSKLLRVQLGRQDFSNYLIKTNKFARFILHILAVNDSTGAPGKSIVSRDITLKDNSRMVAIDFSKENISLPTKFFVSVEHLFIPFNEVISIAPAKKAAGVNKNGDQVIEDAPAYIVQYQPFISWIKQSSTNVWRMNKKGEWVTGQSAGTMALSATILY